jgi:hypothetical protein
MKQYYSIRTGKNKNFSRFNLDILKRLFLNFYKELNDKGYFQEYFGYNCIDADGRWIQGKLGKDIDAQIYRLLRKDNLWPIEEKIKDYSEDDLFDVIEFLYDYISKPIKTPGAYHSYGDCGWHYSKFNEPLGRAEYCQKLSDILSEYSTGFEVSSMGLIFVKDGKGLSSIYKAVIPTENDAIKIKIDLAVEKYLESRSNLETRRIAIRELADTLEILRDDAKNYLHKKDESDLFNIANCFAIRHANDKQRINYDRDIWYSWMFYFYLATIHALLRIKGRKK